MGFVYHWDPRPWIMLNLIFSTQAAYAAPLILLAQTRQADRDKVHGEEIDDRHTKLEQMTQQTTDKLVSLLESNTKLTDEAARLAREIHALLTQQTGR